LKTHAKPADDETIRGSGLPPHWLSRGAAPPFRMTLLLWYVEPRYQPHQG